MSVSETWWFTAREFDDVILIRLNSDREARLVIDVERSGKSPACVQIKSVSDESGQKYLTTLSLERFIVIDERFRVLDTGSVATFLKNLTAVVNGHGLKYFESISDSINSGRSDPQAQSTPKNAAEYKCEFSFQEQVRIFRSLHPKAGMSENDSPLDKADKVFRSQAMKAMNLDPATKKAFFGGKFKVALEISCFSARCYGLALEVMERLAVLPNTINSSLFRETCGFKDESKLHNLLESLAAGCISRNDFNKALSDEKQKTHTQLLEEIEKLKNGMRSLEAKLCSMEEENKKLKEKLASQQDIYTFTDDNQAGPSNSAAGNERTPVLTYSRRQRVSMPPMPTFSDCDLSTSGELDGSMSPAFEPSLRGEEMDEDPLNESFIEVPQTPIVSKKKGIVASLFKKCELFKGKKRKTENVVEKEISDTENTRQKRRVSQIFSSGDCVIALWEDKDPQLKNLYPGKITSVISADLYKVQFEDGCERFVKRKDIKKEM